MGLNSVGVVKHTSTVVLKDPRDRKTEIPGPGGKPLSITLYGPYSETYRRLMRQQQQERMADLTAADAEKRATLTIEEVEELNEAMLRGCIESWNMSFEGDEVLPLTEENINAVFTAHPWVRDQLLEVFGQVSRFLERPAP
jgi:hypothetical protein